MRILERKVEELVAQQPYQSRQTEEPVLTPLLNHSSTSSTAPGASQWPASTGIPSSLGLAGSTPVPVSSVRVNSIDGETRDIIDRNAVTPELAQILLDRFRTSGSQQFPFVVIPANAPLEAVR